MAGFFFFRGLSDNPLSKKGHDILSYLAFFSEKQTNRQTNYKQTKQNKTKDRKTIQLDIFIGHDILNGRDPKAARPIKTLKMHFQMLQFFIIRYGISRELESSRD